VDVRSYYFLADYHALVKNRDPDRMRQSTLEIAATWLALGLDTNTAVFYRQSDVPEILELTWILTCSTAKGLMNRAHAYKAVVQENVDAGEDPDFAVNMGLFSYPVLMAADILMFNSSHVPVGKDQQHLEMARDIAQRFNHHYGEHFVLPEAVTDEHVAVLPGQDGHKMSKSYNNTIPLWLPEKQLRKAIMKIVTNSLEPGESKDPDDSALFKIYAAFASQAQRETMRQAYRDGIAWGEAKQQTFELINEELTRGRERYEALIAEPGRIEETLIEGAEKARAYAAPFLGRIRDAVGIRKLG
jgi:tryptophanyl-tRNA synthetase